MLDNTTPNSRAISFLLFVRVSSNYDIGIYQGKYYSYSKQGAFEFDLRNDWEKDHNFPANYETKKRISTKALIPIIKNSYNM